MELQIVYVLQFVKSFIIYYIICVCPRIWLSRVYVQKIRWKSVKKSLNQKFVIIKSFLPASVERKIAFRNITTKPKIGILSKLVRLELVLNCMFIRKFMNF